MKNGGIKMKKIILVLLALLLVFSLSGCVSEISDSENVKIDFVDESSVGFYPVCPYCSHISNIKMANKSKGESFSSSYCCEECEKVYTIEFERK